MESKTQKQKPGFQNTKKARGLIGLQPGVTGLVTVPSEQCHTINTDHALEQGVRYSLFPSAGSEPISSLIAGSGNAHAVREHKRTKE